MAASRQHQRTEIRRAWRLNAILAGLLAMALAAAGLAIWQRQTALGAQQTALGAQRVALSRQLAAQSTALIGADPHLAALLAVRAYRTSPTSETATGVYAAAGLPLLRRLTGLTEPGRGVVFSPDGRTVATVGNDNTVRLWDVATTRVDVPLTSAYLDDLFQDVSGRTRRVSA